MLKTTDECIIILPPEIKCKLKFLNVIKILKIVFS